MKKGSYILIATSTVLLFFQNCSGGFRSTAIFSSLEGQALIDSSDLLADSSETPEIYFPENQMGESDSEPVEIHPAPQPSETEQSEVSPSPPPSAPIAPIPRAKIIYKNRGQAYKDSVGAVWDHYAFNWASAFYHVNRSGKSYVIKSIKGEINVHSGLGLGETGLDLCGAIVEAQTDKPTANNIEQICFVAYKPQGAQNFVHTKFDIELPGQGILFPNNTYFAFNGQGVSATGGGNYAADISVEVVMEEIDLSLGSLPAVQSLRAPYIDQFFYQASSASTPHTNTTNLSRPVLGAWTYITTFTNSVTNCYGTKKSGTNQWGQNCQTYNSSVNRGPAPFEVIKLGYQFEPGDQIAAQCHVTEANPLGSICATYFFVAVPVVNGVLHPLQRNQTLLTEDAQKFCDGTLSLRLSDSSITPEVCKSVLD